MAHVEYDMTAAHAADWLRSSLITEYVATGHLLFRRLLVRSGSSFSTAHWLILLPVDVTLLSLVFTPRTRGSSPPQGPRDQGHLIICLICHLRSRPPATRLLSFFDFLSGAVLNMSHCQYTILC